MLDVNFFFLYFNFTLDLCLEYKCHGMTTWLLYYIRPVQSYGDPPSHQYVHWYEWKQLQGEIYGYWLADGSKADDSNRKSKKFSLSVRHKWDLAQFPNLLWEYRPPNNDGDTAVKNLIKKK